MILLQVVMVSPKTHFVKHLEPQPWANESQLKKQRIWNKLKMLRLLCNQTVLICMKTDSKTLFYSILKLKCSPFILRHNKGQKNYATLNNSHSIQLPQKLHEKDISTKTHGSIDQSLRPVGCMPWIILHLLGFLCVRDVGHRGNTIIAINPLNSHHHQFSQNTINTYLKRKGYENEIR